jgi:hypothetical protein
MSADIPIRKDTLISSYQNEPSIRGYLPFLELQIIPFDHFHVYRDWLRPMRGMYRISVLFIAESPPWHGLRELKSGNECTYPYFYNDAYRSRTSLRHSILSRLDVTGALSEQRQLQAFRDNHLFLTDPVKCAFRKDLHPSIPKSLIRFSAGILREEIAWLRPRYIVALGSTAFQAIQTIVPEEFRGYHRISEVPPRLSNERFLVMPYPNARNRGNYGNRLDNGFDLVNELIRSS